MGRRRSHRGFTIAAAVVAIATVSAMSCSFKSGVVQNPDGGSSAKAFGPSGADDRFTWSDSEVVDRQTDLVWDRRATERLDWKSAQAFCAEKGARLPTQLEQGTMSEFADSDLLMTDWPDNDTWSTTEKDTSAIAGVRCVHLLHEH